MTTTPTLTILPKPRSRRRRYWIGGFVLLVILTPFLVSFIAGWWSERRLQALYAEIDWTSLAVVVVMTIVFTAGAIVAYDPARGLIARRGGGGG